MGELTRLSVTESTANHKIARFKAKYGVSNSDVSAMLGISSKEIREKLINDSFTSIQQELMAKIERVIERTIREANLLQDHAPFLEVLRHEGELKDKSITKLSGDLSISNKRVNEYRKMKLIDRLKFLIKGKYDEKTSKISR